MSWKDDIRRDIKSTVTEELKALRDTLHYKELYEQSQQREANSRREIEKLQQKVSELSAERPTESEKQIWEATRQGIKDMDELRALSYNKGYSAAYIEITNAMRSGKPVVEQTNPNYRQY